MLQCLLGTHSEFSSQKRTSEFNGRCLICPSGNVEEKSGADSCSSQRTVGTGVPSLFRHYRYGAPHRNEVLGMRCDG